MFQHTRRHALVGLLMCASVTACGGPSADEHFQKGNEYLEQSRLAEAAMEYRLALQEDPQRGDVRLKLADLHLRNRDGAAALKEFVRAADLLPQDATAQVKAGSMLLLANAFEDAKTRAEKALKLDPKNVEAQLLLGNALAGLKDLDGALLEYQEALVLNPAMDAAYANIGVIQLAKGQKAEAEATFRKAVEAAPASASAHLALANFLWATQRIPEAEQAFKEALKLNPADLGANRALGMFYMASGRAAEAEPFFQAIADNAKTTEAIISLADYYVVMRRPDDAKRVLGELAKKDAAFATATVRLAAIEAAQNNRAVAAAKVQEVLDKYPKDSPARLLQTRLLLVDNKRDEALAKAEAIVKDESAAGPVAEAYLIIGAIHASRDRTDDAIRAYEEVLKRQSQPVAALMALSALHLGNGALDKAADYAQQALTIQPKNPLARSQMVRISLARGDAAKAAAELASLEKEFPNALPVLNLVAARHLTERRPDAARAAYLKVLAMAPNDLDAVAGLIAIDLMNGRKKEAVARVEDALKRMEPSTNLLVLAARTLGSTGDMARAEALLKQAIEADPSRLTAYGLLGQLYVSQKRLGEAGDQFRALIQRTPQSVSANTMLGMILESEGRIPEAEQQYQKTLGIDPTAPVAANNLAWIYVAGNRNLDQALELAQTAQRKLPDQPNVNDTLGWIYYRKGLTSQAIRHLEMALQKDATDPATHYHLGMAYIQAGYRDRARQALEKSLSKGAAFEEAPEAKRALAQLGGAR